MNNTWPTPTELTTNTTFWDESLILYHENNTGALTKAQANFIAFPSLATITNDSETLLIAVEAQNVNDYLPPIYASNKELLAGIQAQRATMVSYIRNGSVAVAELPATGSGGFANALMKPFSRGTVHLNATDPYGVPLVLHDSLHNPFDKAAMFRFIQYSRRLFASEAMSVLDPVEVLPGVQYHTKDEAIDAMIESGWLLPTFSHASCSCPMMPQDLGGVVDPELKVYGTERLSIIDASILPLIPAAHLQATMYAVAEKASDIIKGRAGGSLRS